MIKKCNTKKWRLVIYWAFFFISGTLIPQQTYFQQEVNYKIDVRLDDNANALSAKEEIQYINKSATSLDFIYFHLWPNAYRNKNTALAKQLLQQGKTEMYYAKPEELGFIDSLDFKINGKSIKWEYDKENSDICKLILSEALKSLDTLIIETPFYVKIPDAKFSRLGHEGQAYFITQWYPKPAVFDKNGWHPMPYLDQGEFYSEFGSFDVKITLPKNYLLAATGDRIDEDVEEDFLNSKVIETINHIDKNTRNGNGMSFPLSSKEFKTVRFKQYRVHDFAWFADKRFYVLHDQIDLPNTQRTIDTWVFFTDKNFDLWKDALSYVNESTMFYSHLNGDYPYNHVTAVDGTIMAGSGMEYPNITVIGDATSKLELDLVIAHEVGHNWFYGVLGSNEREYPFLDEGINSFYEMRYMRAKYPEIKLTDLIGRDSTFKFLGLNKRPRWREKETAYFMSLKARAEQPILTAANDMTFFNYGSIIYSKTPVVLDYIMETMGEAKFDEAMKFYFKEFKFKHPSPEDFFKTIEFFAGPHAKNFEQNLFATSKTIDYKIKRVRRLKDGTYSFLLKNKTGTNLPFNVYAYKNNRPVGVIWYDGFVKTKTDTFPQKDIDYFKIDGNDIMPDINRKNNISRVKGLFKKAKPIQLNFVTKLDNPAKTQINYLPIIGANFYNGPMVGLALHNYGFSKKRLEYHIVPFFAFRSKTLAGFGELNGYLFPKGIIQQITLGTKIKSFAYDYFDGRKAVINGAISYYNYYKILNSVTVEFKRKRPTDLVTHFVSYAAINLFTDSAHYILNNRIYLPVPETRRTASFAGELRYDLINKRSLGPFDLHLNLQHTAMLAKISATFNYKVNLNKKSDMSLRLFAGSFMAGNERDKGYYSFRASGYNGYQDYLFEDNFIARNETHGLGFSQFAEKDGALKIWTPLGQTTQWLTSINIKSPRLFILPLRFFADVVVCDGRALNKEQLLWDTGLNLSLWKDIIEVYIPFTYSTDIRRTLELNKIDFFNRVRFTLNIHKLAPKDFIQNSIF